MQALSHLKSSMRTATVCLFLLAGQLTGAQELKNLLFIPSEEKAMLALYAELENNQSELSEADSRRLLLLQLSLHEALGDGEKVNQDTIAKSDEHLKKFGDSSHARAIKASSGCRQALYVKSIGNKMLEVRKCTLALDKLVMIEPENLNIRLVRGNTYMQLPEMFKAFGKAEEDWRKMYDAATASKNPELIGMSAYKLGLLLKKTDKSESEKYLRLAASAGDAFWAGQAKQELN